jgi:dihydroflavonol-4-reductase
MTRALILGATGCIGNNTVRAALAAGWQVRAFHRPTSQTWMLDGLDVEHALGDLDDPASLVEAMRGCDLVIHSAAYYPLHSLDMPGSLHLATSQMRHVLAAVAEARVARLVYTSSLTTVGASSDPGRLADERDYSLPRS